MNQDAETRTLAQLVVHIDYMRAQMDDFATKLSKMATQDDIAALRREIEANSPSAMFSQITKVAVGIITVAAAVGVIIAILKAFKAI